MTYQSCRSDRSLATGIIDPESELLFSIDEPDRVTFSHTAGKLQFSDGFTDPYEQPLVVIVDVPARSGIVPEFLLTDSASVVYWDINGDIVQQNVVRGGEFLRDHVQGTILFHVERDTLIDSSNVTHVAISNIAMGFSDLSFSMGNVSTPEGDKNRLSGVSSTTTVQKADGSINFHGLNARTVPDGNKSPNIRQSAAVDGSLVAVAWTTSDSEFGKFAFSTTGIDPTVYDDGTAVEADTEPQGSVGDQQWQNVRVSTSSDNDLLVFHYGIKLYPSSVAARIGIASEQSDLLPIAAQSMATGTLTIRGGATDTTDTDDAVITDPIPVRASFR